MKGEGAHILISSPKSETSCASAVHGGKSNLLALSESTMAAEASSAQADTFVADVVHDKLTNIWDNGRGHSSQLISGVPSGFEV